MRETPDRVHGASAGMHPEVERAQRFAWIAGLGSWLVGLVLFAVACAWREPWLFGAFLGWYVLMTAIVALTAVTPRKRQSKIDRETARKFRDLSEHDDLTGLYNRRYFNAELDAQIAVCKEQRVALTIGLIDLNDFKSINDSFGHAAGDMALRIAGQAILDASPRGSTVARTGGDEFAVIMPGVPRDGAENVAARIRHAIEAANFVIDGLTGGRGRIHATVGMATLGENSDPSQLLQEADSALYEGKRALRAA